MAITDEIPKSRLTLTYRTNVHGEPEDVALPFRVLVVGDLSAGTSADRKVDLDQRQIRRLDGKNLDQVMGDMNMSVKVTVPNRIDPERGEELVAELPIRSMKSFSPAEVAKNVPKVRALLLLKRLLLEVQAPAPARPGQGRRLQAPLGAQGLRGLQASLRHQGGGGPGRRQEGGRREEEEGLMQPGLN
jgi:type VI secretion system protein ImpB